MGFYAAGRMATRRLAGKMPAATTDQGRQTVRLLNASPAQPCKTHQPFVACCNKHKGYLCVRTGPRVIRFNVAYTIRLRLVLPTSLVACVLPAGPLAIGTVYCK